MKERNGSVLGVSRFGPYVLDEAERVLLKDGQPVKLTARMFDVLAILVRNAGKLVTKDDLLRLAWPGVIVEESNIHVQISALRAILGRDAITTVARMGYRLEMSLDAEEETRRGAIVGSNVPHPVSPIVGRQRELAEIAALIEETARVAATCSAAQAEAHVALDPLRLDEASAAAAISRPRPRLSALSRLSAIRENRGPSS